MNNLMFHEMVILDKATYKWPCENDSPVASNRKRSRSFSLLEAGDITSAAIALLTEVGVKRPAACFFTTSDSSDSVRLRLVEFCFDIALTGISKF